ncbi:glycosyltransferase [Thermodesulfovibrio sp.]|uniref:glycosyltransferase n=1 Tax=Thermodesulfovibrio sp. TaxID=2067987 RepID=UPI0026029F85|nr:glycosyltransferase [Thermodesulfovibrio sp.]
MGGVENQLLMVLRNYNREKFKPFVCSLSDKGEIGKEIESLGIKVFTLNKLGHTFNRAIIRDICKIIKNNEIKIVRTHQYHANFYGRIAAKISKVPCIVASIHNVYTRDKKFHRRFINRLLAKITDKIIAVSEEVKKDILKYDKIPEDKIKVIYNGIDPDIFSNNFDKDTIKKSLGIDLKAPVIGTVGRLTMQKGQIYLLEAIAKIKGRFPYIKVLIVGDGPLMEEFKKYVKSTGISENVIFTGSRRDVPALLSIMDIFVFPSLWEGLPNALIESMAAGKAIIASDLKPIREILNSEGECILVQPKNSMAIAESIELLLKDKNLRDNIGRNVQNKAFSCFNIKTTVKIYGELFEKILRSKGWNI